VVKIREDLRDRLGTFPVRIPPLRERKLDLLMLAELVVQEEARRTGKAKRLHESALGALLTYDWPGNVRQLQNVVRRAVELSGEVAVVQAGDVLACVRQERELEGLSHGEPGSDLPGPHAASQGGRFPTLQEVEEAHVDAVLEFTGGNVSRAAHLLGIARSTLRSRLQARER
jgi:DNA-binding NtrC family response regulator